MMAEEPEKFREAVQASLRRQVAAINRLAAKGMYFFDYGNAFLLESSRAGADILKADGTFRYPSYVQDIMGPLYLRLRFRPVPLGLHVGEAGRPRQVRRVCREYSKRNWKRLRKRFGTAERQYSLDRGSRQEPSGGRFAGPHPLRRLRGQDQDRPGLQRGHPKGEISAPIVLGRDHHDVSGTDSPSAKHPTSTTDHGTQPTWPSRTSSVTRFRGATWVSIHNGGGVGWGEVINGGFGMVIDGSADSDRHIRRMLFWDVNNGIARRSWARNEGAEHAIIREMERTPELTVTVAQPAQTTSWSEKQSTKTMTHIISHEHLSLRRLKEIIENHERRLGLRRPWRPSRNAVSTWTARWRTSVARSMDHHRIRFPVQHDHPCRPALAAPAQSGDVACLRNGRARPPDREADAPA